MLFTSTGIDLGIVIDLEMLSEVSQTKKDKYHVILICGIKKRYRQTYLQNRNRLTDIENEFMVTRGEGGIERKMREKGVWD